MSAEGISWCSSLDDALVSKSEARTFAERSIHGAIYRSRPDVLAVCHHHAPTMMPFCTSGCRAFVPRFSISARPWARSVPLWDSQDEFGDTQPDRLNAERKATLARNPSDPTGPC